MKPMRWLIFIAIWMLWSVAGVVTAQGGVITYGETRSDALSDAAPQILYSITGNENEVVTVYVLGWAEAFQPSLTILGPTGQIAFSNSDALTPILNDARATVSLPATGNYSLLVGSANGVFNTFTIAVRLTTPGISTQLGADGITLNIPPGGQSQTVAIPASPTADIPVSIASTTPGFMFAAHISAPDGRVIMAIDGALSSVSVVLPASDKPYTIVVSASNATDSGTITISQSGIVTDTGAPAPAVTEEVGNTDAPPTDQCSTTAGEGGVNIRSGPGTDYAVIGGLAPNAYIVVTGQNNGWYTGSTIYGAGWIAGSVVTLSGPCNNLPVVNAPPLPTATAVPPTATYTPTTDTNVTATPTATTDGNQPTATYTATATTEAQIATIDNDHNLAVDRDNGGSFSNDVSSPDGDTSDRIRVTIDNLLNQTPNNYREMTLTLTCFGEGAENVTWGTGGPSSPTSNACNQSLQATHTNDSNQTFVNVNMSGSGYVTYTLIVTING